MVTLALMLFLLFSMILDLSVLTPMLYARALSTSGLPGLAVRCCCSHQIYVICKTKAADEPGTNWNDSVLRSRVWMSGRILLLPGWHVESLHQFYRLLLLSRDHHGKLCRMHSGSQWSCDNGCAGTLGVLQLWLCSWRSVQLYSVLLRSWHHLAWVAGQAYGPTVLTLSDASLLW